MSHIVCLSKNEIHHYDTSQGDLVLKMKLPWQVNELRKLLFNPDDTKLIGIECETEKCAVFNAHTCDFIERIDTPSRLEMPRTINNSVRVIHWLDQ